MSETDWNKLELITQAEHHFNNLCFKIRALASTWLLATMGGVGFFLSKSIEPQLPVSQLLILLCYVGALGILVLWVLDLLIYQKMLNVWFSSREQIEQQNNDFPQIYQGIKSSQPGGRATTLLKVFYQSLIALPMSLAVYISVYMPIQSVWTIASIFLGIFLLAIVQLQTPRDR